MANFFHDIEQFSDATALVTEEDKRYSYSQLLETSDLLQRYIPTRSLVVSVCRNSFESVVGYLGCLRSRSVPILFNDGSPAVFLKNLLQNYQPAFLWVPLSSADSCQACTEVYRLGNFCLLKTPYEQHPLHDDLALLLTTSGSTGSPKLVRLSYNNLISNANSIAHYLEISKDDRPITTLPMSYSYGLSIINSHLLKGCTLVLANRTLTERAFWVLLEKHQATTFGGVPFIYEMLSKLRFSRMHLPSLKTLTQAGGKLHAALVEEFAEVCGEKGIRFIVMYGQTEATARMSYLPSHYAKVKPQSIGVAIPGGQFWLEDDEGRVIDEADVVGELIYRGENVAMGYASSYADLVQDYDHDNTLRTGDMAKRDAEGFYYIAGRRKRFLKMFGNRVNLDEIEQLLKGSGYDCACAGEDDRMRIYTPQSSRLQDIKKHLAEQTGIHASAFEVHHVDALPRNEAGKTIYGNLK